MIRVTLILWLSCFGCVPSYLRKKEEGRHHQKSPPGESLQGALPKSSTRLKEPVEVEPAKTVYAIDKQTFRFRLDFEDVWNAALEILIKNYNLNIIQKESGLITTEWDSYYLKGALYRNKMTLRMKKSSWKTVDISLYNNVELLRGNLKNPAAGSVWLPSKENSQEINRIVQNMAIYLNQHPPYLPQTTLTKKDINMP